MLQSMGFAKSRTWLSDWTELNKITKLFFKKRQGSYLDVSIQFMTTMFGSWIQTIAYSAAKAQHTWHREGRSYWVSEGTFCRVRKPGLLPASGSHAPWWYWWESLCSRPPISPHSSRPPALYLPSCPVWEGSTPNSSPLTYIPRSAAKTRSLALPVLRVLMFTRWWSMAWHHEFRVPVYTICSRFLRLSSQWVITVRNGLNCVPFPPHFKFSSPNLWHLQISPLWEVGSLQMCVWGG